MQIMSMTNFSSKNLSLVCFCIHPHVTGAVPFSFPLSLSSVVLTRVLIKWPMQEMELYAIDCRFRGWMLNDATSTSGFIRFSC